jgi:hypothetical protein
MPCDLVSRLSETLDELERVAREASDENSGDLVAGPRGLGGEWKRDARFGHLVDHGRTIVLDEGVTTDAQFDHIARWDPQAVLQLVGAVRRLVGTCEVWLDDSELAAYAHEVLRDLGRAFGVTEEPSDE